MHKIAIAVAALLPFAAHAQINAGNQATEQVLPFKMTRVTQFNLPWRIAFLPDGRMLVTEKPGGLWLVTQAGEKSAIANVPAVLHQGQGGMLGVYLAPDHAQSHYIYLTYAEPGDGGSGLALARAKLAIDGASASLQELQVIWRDAARGSGGQFGGAVAFAPDGQSLFLTVGERMRMTPAQEADSPLGKILHLTLDGKPAPGNPGAGKVGARTLDIIAPPRNTEAAKTAAPAFTYTFPGDNPTPAQTWSSGHRTPYGLAFGPDGRLWELEHGPRGGDELNLIEPGRNYGWPLVSYATNYDGVPIPNPDSRADLAKPAIYWTPVIAPGNMAFYEGTMFPQWDGSLLVSGLGSQSLTRVAFDAQGNPAPANRWDMKHRIRDVAVAPDGAIWVAEDAPTGGLFRLTPN